MVKDLVPVATALESSIFQEPPIIITKPWSLVNTTPHIFFTVCETLSHQLLKGNFTNQEVYGKKEDACGPSSIYLLALRNTDISICFSANKYTKLLNYNASRDIYSKKNIFIVD
jgi:hypothetical protein